MEKNTKKIIITGGAGFIGSALIRHIINNTEHSVVNADKLTYAGNLESLISIEKSTRYSFEQVDICEATKIKQLFSRYQPDIIMHLAAESHVDRSIDGPSEFIQTNIVGKALEFDYYFAHPYSSWERGLNENTNGLIRQYFPKGNRFEEVTERMVKRAKGQLNRHPRKTLGYATPTKVFFGKSFGEKIALQG